MLTRSSEPRPLEFYGDGLPYLGEVMVKGRLIVIEGPDGSGRSTQVQSIVTRLESDGHAVVDTGLKRSELIGQGILEAKQRLPLGKRTLTLFYAADFVDQLEHKIIPALQAGYIVLADRYIFTLIARSIARGLPRNWSHNVFGFAPKVDLAFYLDVKPSVLFHRVFQKYGNLDYYESGADLGLSDNLYDSFIAYQNRMAKEFAAMASQYGMVRVDGDRSIGDVNASLQSKIDEYLKSI
ncbi:MAG TPA: thymidylate kinase [Nitrososphaerales archaeon]|nr:thymidylate kinase [Nitrososphaerales archaeon]HUK75282.1 thymidylate kinase [Nitrososphaerales archaeon]